MVIEQLNSDKDYLEKELDEMHMKHEELLEEIEFKDKENFEMMKKIEDLETKVQELEEKLQGKGEGNDIIDD
jgi:peptidoglycan hydrolase CwlO-like protein